ncbi:MAG: adenylate/guanylate cyclase domain-containing protein, partial [Alphaproteobacteria bacterium]|nr:adenylate/guanylate cyclase domain-containing protein [Alphaproteobacteria bacterium]
MTVNDDQPRRAIKAIMAADVVGYTALMAADEARTLADLRALRAKLFEPITERHGGNVFKRMGDGWLVEFASIVAAAQAALAVQQGLATHATIKLRMGIHIGDVVHEGEDIFGDGVNVASRCRKPRTIFWIKKRRHAS